MKTTKKKVRVVRGWVLLDKRGYKNDFYSVTFPIYRRRKDAGSTKTNLLLKDYCVVPCSIAYQLPVKKK